MRNKMQSAQGCHWSYRICELDFLKFILASVIHRGWGAKANQGDQLGCYYMGVVNYYAAIQNNEKEHIEKILDM